VLGTAAAERLRQDERSGNTPAPAPPRTLSSETRVLELPVLQDRTHRVWNEARREFTAARKARSGAGPNAGAPANKPAPASRPEVRPSPAREPVTPDSLRLAPGDSLRTRRGRPPGKPAPSAPDSGHD
jgi:hypothetical protein